MPRTSRQTGEDESSLRTVLATAVVAALVVGIAIIGIRTLGGSDGKSTAQPASVVANPTASAAGVFVTEPSVDLGRVPLNKNIDQSFTLKNGGSGKAQLGKPRIETLEGCWPPQPVVGSTTVEAGAETTVSVSMIMHKGMEGPHLFRITVPVRADSGESGDIQMLVRANFQ